MSSDVSNLLAELPEDFGARGDREELRDLLATLSCASGGAPPTGRIPRLGSLTGLQAQVGAAYLAYWFRKQFVSEDERERLRNETHLRAALRVLEHMGYLRGVVMKLGQLCASYPAVLPEVYGELLSRLHFEAPPMHFALLREEVRNELGADPEELFSEFETQAFAAASLGQVHRARLKSGERVAVKIQYPGIARTIEADFANLSALLLPLRLTKGWEVARAQLEDARDTLLRETDYELEARELERARPLFDEEDGILVPRVHRALSSRRVLTMDLLPGLHLRDFLATRPTQAVRDLAANRIQRAMLRIYYRERVIYADPSAGNLLFLPDGRLGLIDFGCCRTFAPDEWEAIERMARLCERGPECVDDPELVALGTLQDPNSIPPEYRRLAVDSIRWYWEPMWSREAFDFSSDAYQLRGLRSIAEMTRRGYTRSLPVFTWLQRAIYGVRAIYHALGARVDVRGLCLAESGRAT